MTAKVDVLETFYRFQDEVLEALLGGPTTANMGKKHALNGMHYTLLYTCEGRHF